MSIKACEMDCPKSMWQRKCVGNKCPLWVVERVPNGKGAILCSVRRAKKDGSFYDMMEEDPEGFNACLAREEVLNCIDCDFALGHCSG